jgi:hypothetical protein
MRRVEDAEHEQIRKGSLRFGPSREPAEREARQASRNVVGITYLC